MQEINDWTNNPVPKYTDIFASDMSEWMSAQMTQEKAIVKSKRLEELIGVIMTMRTQWPFSTVVNTH